MKKFSISFGKLNTTDILKIVGSIVCMGGGLALLTDVTDGMAWRQGRDDTLTYLNRTEQYDTLDVLEIKRRGEVYDAEKFLAEQKGAQH